MFRIILCCPDSSLLRLENIFLKSGVVYFTKNYCYKRQTAETWHCLTVDSVTHVPAALLYLFIYLYSVLPMSFHFMVTLFRSLKLKLNKTPPQTLVYRSQFQLHILSNISPVARKKLTGWPTSKSLQSNQRCESKLDQGSNTSSSGANTWRHLFNSTTCLKGEQKESWSVHSYCGKLFTSCYKNWELKLSILK